MPIKVTASLKEVTVAVNAVPIKVAASLKEVAAERFTVPVFNVPSMVTFKVPLTNFNFSKVVERKDEPINVAALFAFTYSAKKTE